MVKVLPSQVAQCTKVLVVRCFDPRRIRTKRSLLENYDSVSA